MLQEGKDLDRRFTRIPIATYKNCAPGSPIFAFQVVVRLS
jgi:hypothetical protein